MGRRSRNPDVKAKAYTPPQSILVVDDDADARNMLAEYLVFCGFGVHRAEDGAEAIAVARRVDPCLILMDLMMPRMDGWEAARRLKTDQQTSRIPIIAVSACVHADEQARARRVGCDDFLPKPVDLDQLVAVVNQLLESGPSDAAAGT